MEHWHLSIRDTYRFPLGSSRYRWKNRHWTVSSAIYTFA